MSTALRRPLILAAAALATIALAACGGGARTGTVATRATTVQTAGNVPRYLRLRARPIGKGPRFRPPLSAGDAGSPCTKQFGRRYQAHIELFGANRVVLLPAGIGTRPPRKFLNGQLTKASCFGPIVTLNSTGVVYLRRPPRSYRGPVATLGELFSAWNQPLTRTRIASFTGGKVRAWVNGRRYRGNPRELRIEPREEIVIEVGPYVPPHTRFTFAPIPQVG